ncbi:MAG: hypothetical protein PHW56_05760 [Methanosarcinaceae archaeon]|nr:hypothetical protein [Methanosarcinaceae archaeon]
MVTREFEIKVFNELDYIKKQLGEIRERMVDVDSILTEEEKELVERSFENEAGDRLLNLKDLDTMLAEDKGFLNRNLKNETGDKLLNLKGSFRKF